MGSEQVEIEFGQVQGANWSQTNHKLIETEAKFKELRASPSHLSKFGISVNQDGAPRSLYSLLGRREVLTGKAKFGIFGDGKEVPQLAMAKSFKNGDFRSGYYRDQTFMMAIGELTSLEFFAGLYAHTDLDYDPMSAGRQMGGHFTTHSLDDQYEWKDLTAQKNSSSDISPTASQMPRLLGLAQASKIYRHNKDFDSKKFSICLINIIQSVEYNFRFISRGSCRAL